MEAKKNSEQAMDAVVEQKPEREDTLQDMGYTPSEVSDEDVAKIIANMPQLSDSKYATAGTLKIMDGPYGGGFFVRYLQDDGSKYGWLELTILYPDDTFKKILLYKNALRQTSTDSDGVYARPVKNRDGTTYRVVRRMEKLDTDKLFLHRFERPDMPIPVDALTVRIKDNYGKIPISKVHDTSTLTEIYYDLYCRAKEYSNGISLAFMDSNDRFYVPSGDFNEIVEYHGWSKSKAKTTLTMLGLLISDKSPTSFQLTKRVRGKLCRFYVLRKNLPQKVTDPTSLEDTTFQDYLKSEDQVENEKLKKQYQELENELLAIRASGKEPDLGVLV